MLLTNLKIGGTGRVVRFMDTHIESKLVTIGILPNTALKLVRKAPLGGAFYVEVNAHLYALRKEEAASIEIEIIANNQK